MKCIMKPPRYFLSISVAFFFWSEKVYTFRIGMSGLSGCLYGVLWSGKYRVSLRNVYGIVNDMERIVMYTDGGSRGNPGPSALGVFIETLGVRYGEFLGNGTNNEAEYAAILSGMRRVVLEIGEARAREAHLECRMDSELAMRQLTGRYRVKHPRMKHWFDLIQAQKSSFVGVSFHHVLREKNKEADRMVNEALDKATSSR